MEDTLFWILVVVCSYVTIGIISDALVVKWDWPRGTSSDFYRYLPTFIIAWPIVNLLLLLMTIKHDWDFAIGTFRQSFDKDRR